MTRFEARRLLLVLVAKGIPYALRRNGSTFSIEYDKRWTSEVRDALGADLSLGSIKY